MKIHKADLQTHTVSSFDCSKSSKVIHKAQIKRIDLLAITDHDAISLQRRFKYGLESMIRPI